MLRNVSDVTGVFRNFDLGSSVLLLGGPPWAASLALYAGYAIAGGAMLFSLRRDRELSYVVTVMATLLVAPLLWDHYLTMLLLPAAFLASRGRRGRLLLPLLCWAPQLLACGSRRRGVCRVHAAARGAGRAAAAVRGAGSR